MFALAMITLAVALAASVWTTAYAWNATVPDLLWLQQVRRWDDWLDGIEALHEQLDLVLALDAEQLLAPCS